MIILNTGIYKIIIKVNKKWLQEEEQLEKKQQKEEQREEKEDDAESKGIYGLVIKLNRDSSIEIVRLTLWNPYQGCYVHANSVTLPIH